VNGSTTSTVPIIPVSSSYEYGNTFPIHEAHFESKIKYSAEIINNPFENESIFPSIDGRATENESIFPSIDGRATQ